MRLLPARARAWLNDSPTITRREFDLAFGILFLLVTIALVAWGEQVRNNHKLILKTRELSREHVAERVRVDSSICRKVDRLDSGLIKVVGSPTPAPRPGQYGYDYWVKHPEEKIGRPGSRSPAQGAATARILAELRKAACDPTNLRKPG